MRRYSGKLNEECREFEIFTKIRLSAERRNDKDDGGPSLPYARLHRVMARWLRSDAVVIAGNVREYSDRMVIEFEHRRPGSPRIC